VTRDEVKSPGELLSTLRELRHLPAALGIVRRAAGWRTTVWLLLLVVQGILPVLSVVLTKLFVDALVAAMKSGQVDAVRRPLMLAVALATVLLAVEALRAATRWLRTAQGDLVRDHITALIHERASAVDLAAFDSPEFYDKLHRARVDARQRPATVVENFGSLLQSALTLVAMGAVLLRFGWWLPLALLASTIPALAVVVRFALANHRFRMRITEDERRSWYYDWLLTAREAAAELRLFELAHHFRRRFDVLQSRLRGEHLELLRRQALGEVMASVAGMAVLGFSLLWMVRRAVAGNITLGDLAMFVQAFFQGQKLMRSLLETVGQIYSNSLFLGNLMEFLALEPGMPKVEGGSLVPLESAPALAFRGVTFRYPGSEEPVFQELDLEIPGGCVTALIGDNGAGKSTLIKLFCRLYDPEDGRVEMGGVDLRNMAPEEVRRRMTALFQEPLHFNETLRHNVELGDLRAAKNERVEGALDAAGAAGLVGRLPNGLDTLLGRWYAGGEELSVGEWQRIALARAFLRDAPVVLLDEPTSAMDSWAEAEWLGRFLGLVKGRTAVIVTHRLTTARRADLICLMSNGRITERGTHEELLAAGGRYAESWRRQIG